MTIHSLSDSHRHLEEKLKETREQLDEKVFAEIKAGTFGSSRGDQTIVNVLHNLVRLGLIENRGSKRVPNWVVIKERKTDG